MDLFERLDNDFNFRHGKFGIPARCRKVDISACSEAQMRSVGCGW